LQLTFNLSVYMRAHGARRTKTFVVFTNLSAGAFLCPTEAACVCAAQLMQKALARPLWLHYYGRDKTQPSGGAPA
jgi:hypothetical protein